MVGVLFSILLWSWTSLYSFICNLLLMIISIKFWERRKRKSGRMLESVHVIAMSVHVMKPCSGLLACSMPMVTH